MDSLYNQAKYIQPLVYYTMSIRCKISVTMIQDTNSIGRIINECDMDTDQRVFECCCA